MMQAANRIEYPRHQAAVALFIIHEKKCSQMPNGNFNGSKATNHIKMRHPIFIFSIFVSQYITHVNINSLNSDRLFNYSESINLTSVTLLGKQRRLI